MASRQAEPTLRAPWIIRRGDRLPSWLGEGGIAASNLKVVPIERHKVRVFGLTNAEADAFTAGRITLSERQGGESV